MKYFYFCITNKIYNVHDYTTMKSHHTKTIQNTKNFYMLMLTIAIVTLGLGSTLSGIAFAQEYTDADNPHGPQAIYGWSAMVAAAGVMSGVGVFTAIKKK